MSEEEIKKFDMFCYYNDMEFDDAISRIEGQLEDRKRIKEVNGQVIQLRPNIISLDNDEALRREIEYPLIPGDDWNETQFLYWRIRNIVGRKLAIGISNEEATNLIDLLNEVHKKTIDFEIELYDSTQPIRERIERDFTNLRSKLETKGGLAYLGLIKLCNVDPVFEVKPIAFQLEGIIDILHGYVDATQTKDETIHAMKILYDITEKRIDDITAYSDASRLVANGVGSLMKRDENGSHYWDIGNTLALLPPKAKKHERNNWYQEVFPNNSSKQRRFIEQVEKLDSLYEIKYSYEDVLASDDHKLILGYMMGGLPWVKEDKTDPLFKYQSRERPKLIEQFPHLFESMKEAALSYFGNERNIPSKRQISYPELYRVVEGIGSIRPHIEFSPTNN